MTIVRQERLDDAKRARLMEAAVEEFTERGLEAASYNKIIERSGLSKGTVYYYFDNKEALLYTVLEDIGDRFLAAMGEQKLPETREEYRIVDREYHKRAIHFFLENPSLTHILFMLSGRDPRFDERLQRIHEKLSAFMYRLLERGQEIGAVRDDLPLDTIERLMHALGDVLCTLVVGEWKLGVPKDSAKMQAQVKKFVFLIDDLSARILAPGEVQDV